MKNFYFLTLLSLFATALTISSCLLEKEPSIPEGTDNIVSPGFLSSEFVIVSDTIVQTTTQLNALGNLNILRHGWVWGKTKNPTLQDNSLDSGKLTVQTFSAQIAGLEPGVVYHLRPYVSTISETKYGDDDCVFLGVGFAVNTGTVIYLGSEAQFNNTTPVMCTWSWDFGDGKSSNEFSPKHTYTETGTITVRLTADNSGCKVSKTLTMTVLPNPFDDYWVDIPEGTFMMGCTSEQGDDCDPDENPVHEVSIEAFMMGKTEITQGQWLAVMGGANPSFFKLCLDCPVENVSWNDAHAFIDKLNATLPSGSPHYRLPTESEWEYAARGNQPFKYSGSDDRDSVSWNSDNSLGMTHPVRMRKANGFGLFDMSGNVREWVEDDYHYDEDTELGYTDAPEDGSAWIESTRLPERVIRSGSWDFDPTNCRTSNRQSDVPSGKDNITGFRLARSY